MRPIETHSGKGIFFVTVGLFLFSIQDVIIKSLSDDYAVLQIVFYRSLAGTLIMFVVLLTVFSDRGRKLNLAWPVYVKAISAFLSYTSFYMAIALLPLADVAAITFSAPIMVTALSAILFRDKVGLRRWAGVLIGFFAIVLVVGPKGHFNNPAVLLALTAALTYAISTITTRYMDPRDDASIAAFYTILIYLVGSLLCTVVIVASGFYGNTSDPSLTFLLMSWQPPSDVHQWLLVCLGFVATAGYFCLVKAYMVAEFSVVAPFEYSYIIWSILFGFLFWRDIPSMATITGITLLIASNLYILRRELQASRRIAHRRPRAPRR